ncbi:hypothetical protein [uncultured Amnibacterium sp.]|uniref:hypothetical protein n=1 Tax=uncultured Amnibacterium sp. TaxID=1631851 RepID=UPI0035CA55AA
MSMSDPFLPIPPEEIADLAEQREVSDAEDDREPDVLPEAGGDDPSELAAAERADQPDRFVTPDAGDRLTTDELEADLD